MHATSSFSFIYFLIAVILTFVTATKAHFLDFVQIAEKLQVLILGKSSYLQWINLLSWLLLVYPCTGNKSQWNDIKMLLGEVTACTDPTVDIGALNTPSLQDVKHSDVERTSLPIESKSAFSVGGVSGCLAFSTLPYSRPWKRFHLSLLTQTYTMLRKYTDDNLIANQAKPCQGRVALFPRGLAESIPWCFSLKPGKSPRLPKFRDPKIDKNPTPAGETAIRIVEALRANAKLMARAETITPHMCVLYTPVSCVLRLLMRCYLDSLASLLVADMRF